MGNRARLGDRKRSAQGGFSLLEAIIAVVVLATALLAFARTVVHGDRNIEQTRQNTIAMQAARQVIETMAAEALAADVYRDIFARYNAFPGDDPDASAPGAGAAVPGLEALPGDADGLPLSIRFPVQAGAPGVLREDVADQAFGTPRDLSADGVWDAGDHSEDYRLLPVVVRVDWRGVKGPAHIELRTQLAELQ